MSNVGKVHLGHRTLQEWDRLLSEAFRIPHEGERIQFLSEYFVGVPYAESTLVGSHAISEVLVIDLERVDCMTFIEYLEAMRLSSSFSDFVGHLRKVRYRGGIVDYARRNHFFTDWKEYNDDITEDVTDYIGGTRTERLEKVLNVREDGTALLPGIDPVARRISYIPSARIDGDALANLMSGDYIGIYSNQPALDVSHTGIVVKKGNAVFLRHASSQPIYKCVVDEELREYVLTKPGILVFRPRKRR